MKKEIWIMGIHITDRMQESQKVQDILTKYGCSIRTRLGLHEAKEGYCAPSGLMILELAGDISERQKLENDLLSLDHIEVKKMVFKQE